MNSPTPNTESVEVYKTPEYQRIANEVKIHVKVLEVLMKQLEEQFPAENKSWVIFGDGYPRRVVTE